MSLAGVRSKNRLAGPWTLFALIGAALVAAPIIVMTGSLFGEDPKGVWPHLLDTVLWRYLWGSAAVTVGAVAVAGTIGTSTAWLVTRLHFPGRAVLAWALLLPMAVPAYVLAYCWTDLLEFAGPVQTWLRDTMGWGRSDYWFPPVRSLPGAILMLGFTLYPYVYLTARAAFIEQGAAMYESARSLGWGPWRCFLSLAVPMARPAIVAGCSLVAMESLADFGTVDYFAVQTFTTGIYRTWTGFGSYTAAVRLAAVMLVLVVVILGLERASRGKRQFHRLGQRQQQPRRQRLIGARAWLATVCCLLPVLLGFVVPGLLLLHHVVEHWSWERTRAMLDPAWTSLQLALITTAVALATAIVIAYGKRLAPGPVLGGAARVAASGYAIPGSVVAVAVIVPLTWIDNRVLDPLFDSGLLLSGGLMILIYAYLVRFLAVAMGAVESGLSGITPSMDRAARSLGAGAGGTLMRVHLPLMRASLATAALMVMVDVLKELPATVLLRPLGVTTLAVRVHEQVSQESLHLAALPALAIVCTGLLPVLLLTRTLTRSRQPEDAA